MTAPVKFGNTIYQRKVKLNVRGLTELRRSIAGRAPVTGNAKSITMRQCHAGPGQRFELRLVQVFMETRLCYAG
jgi:hypothetical protein